MKIQNAKKISKRLLSARRIMFYSAVCALVSVCFYLQLNSCIFVNSLSLDVFNGNRSEVHELKHDPVNWYADPFFIESEGQSSGSEGREIPDLGQIIPRDFSNDDLGKIIPKYFDQDPGSVLPEQDDEGLGNLFPRKFSKDFGNPPSESQRDPLADLLPKGKNKKNQFDYRDNDNKGFFERLLPAGLVSFFVHLSNYIVAMFSMIFSVFFVLVKSPSNSSNGFASTLSTFFLNILLITSVIMIALKKSEAQKNDYVICNVISDECVDASSNGDYCENVQDTHPEPNGESSTEAASTIELAKNSDVERSSNDNLTEHEKENTGNINSGNDPGEHSKDSSNNERNDNND